MTIAANTGAAEWRNGYQAVLTSFFGMGASSLAPLSLGMFMEPMQRELGWGRGEISAGLMIMSGVSSVGAALAGRLMDRFGERRVGVPGMVVYCSGIALLGTSGSLSWNWWALWFVVACGHVFVNPTLWATAVSKRFDVQRGLALAATSCGSGALLVFMPVTVGRLIADHGWRMTYVIMGCATAVVMLPLMMLFLRERRNPAYPPRMASTVDGAASAKSELWMSLRSGRFIRLALGCFIVTTATIGLQVHYVPLLVHGGAGRASAASMAGMIGVGSIVGRLSSGVLLDRWRGQIVGAVYFALPAFSSLFLLRYHGGSIDGSVIAGVQGLALGAELNVVAFLVGRYFGLRNYGTLVGTIMGGVVIGSGLGPTWAGAIFDATNSYRLFVVGAIAAFLIGAALIASLGDYEPRAVA
jgi:MFS family permease